MTTETQTKQDEPAAWIGCLSCYNNGTLRGKWITARQAADEADSGEPISYGNQAADSRCVKCGGDEFEIMDGELLPRTCSTLREFYENAEELATLHDDGKLEQINALASNLISETLEDLIAYDDDNYGGQWSTWQEFADNYADEFLTHEMPEHLAPYFDYEKYARDLAHSYYYDEATGHVWYQA
jgi:antirestriction protein